MVSDADRQRLKERGKQVRDLAVAIVRESATVDRLDELARACYEFDDLFQPPAWPPWTDTNAVDETVRERYRNKARDLLKVETFIQTSGCGPEARPGR
ncbi:hypothetical protein ACTD5D_00300 [Nocardia takedensis]|uniref:hypothetical protein n=1 Tax=Nocardia takedensis TaxID=259390 RepID=UPI003F75828E